MIGLSSPSGLEGRVREALAKHARSFAADTIESDVNGNLYLGLNPKGKPRVMLPGHMDEIALMISYVEDNGYLRFRPVGGFDQCVLPGTRVVISARDGDIPGVVGKEAIHFIGRDHAAEACKDAISKWENLWIDIGVSSREEAEKFVSSGDCAVIDWGYGKLAGHRRVARAFDNRIGAFVVAEVLRYLKRESRAISAAVFAVGTVQEEIGIRGAVTSSYRLEPDIAIAVDVGFATDYPEAKVKIVGKVELGKGPILHRGPNIHPLVENRLEETARRLKIPVQMSASPSATGTDANPIQLSRSGVATALVSIPLRYMHTPAEVLDLRDVDSAIRLIAETVRTFTSRDDLTKRS
jgi:endoglucanase